MAEVISVSALNRYVKNLLDVNDVLPFQHSTVM